ncbi:pirin family protein [Ulvibacterium marinum]|uniref:Pirin family protein n=1 Tax=Ulvibacterium marinum TaxID=2419782 RepID=A0A3B0C432_9FLAO|nr:pirin family protein [Ulvibacterium marinum]RKN78066.1 pirin family protein [Ulvibacterium marinum]
MPFVLHTAESRGHANHGWLDSHHTFSFANYYDSDRMNFGVLRVLNDDVVSEARGFGTHPHNNMEIISIPLEGDLQHMDSMGNSAIIRQGDVQVMSAGTGIQHSEYNKNPDKPVKFLQIWMFPNKQNVEPRYDQISLKDIERKNVFYQILSPNKQDQGVWVHQDAWFHLGDFDSGSSETYTLKKKSNGVYIFVLDGEVLINNQSLGKRDGYGIWEVDGFILESKERSKVLVMEVPMVLS